jgi:tetratricopeptide (TPR) repeat protein
MLQYIYLALIIIIILAISYRIYFRSKLKELLTGKQYPELIEWMKKCYKFRMINPAFSFYLADAAYLYGDESLFHEAARYSLKMRRTTRMRKHVLRCFDAILAYHGGRLQEGMDKYRELMALKPATFGKHFRKLSECLTTLLDGIDAFHSGDYINARALLLQAYSGFGAGASKLMCSLYLSKTFSQIGEPDHAKELETWAKAYAAGSLYAKSFESSPDDASKCPSHPDQDTVGTCQICGTPICIKCINEHHDQICLACYRKTLKVRKMIAARKDCRNYLIACTSVVAGFFVLFTFWMHSTYVNFPVFFQGVNKPYPWNVLYMAGIYTLILSGLFNGIWLFIKFIKNRSKATKITLAVLSIITFSLIYAAGVFLLAPAYIFYICRYIYIRKKIASVSHTGH